MEDGNREDMLSNLPDHILLTILDRLNVRDAARTCVLSRRWQQLPAMLSQIKIDVLDFLPEGTTACYQREIVRINGAAVEATKSIMSRRDPSRNTIHLLSMKFFLRDNDTISIGHAVGQIMATHKVEIAQFAILTEAHYSRRGDDDLVYYGRNFMLFFEACPGAFGGLTCLKLQDLRFGKSDICNVLLTCKQLKHLRMFNCDSGVWATLQVEHLQLSELEIVNCSFRKVVLISLPKLTQMAFHGWIAFQDPLSVGDVPLLETVDLTNVCLSSHKMVKLSEFLGGTSVRNLRLGFESEKIWVQPEHLTRQLASVFCQLTFVHMAEIPEGYDLSWSLFILEAAPNLKELYLTVWDHLCTMETDREKRRALSYSIRKGVRWESSASRFQHRRLETLVIFGFESEEYMLTHVRCVMEAAVNLKNVFLYNRLACKMCRDNPPPSSFPFAETKKLLVEKIITSGIDSAASIHFLAGKAIWASHVAKKNFP
ncbi:uncharacterized protein LOC125538657 isoform X1 [Triticum urartu]|uniref:F-box domain-containing protein n=1 Tax=Triticum urartu TaxID=4572 RepID=A0A8R7TJC8_TRIUA|nr:uncharacterized protein LOC125538657 isoform X1 [Triticum urartu]